LCYKQKSALGTSPCGRAQRVPVSWFDMSEWYSIEVFDGASSASLWAQVHGDPLLESALLMGAKDWTWHHHSWGVVLELQFEDTHAWDAWRAQPHVQAALESVPDPVSGLIVYRGRGGSSGAVKPRKPKPLRGSGAAALPLPWDWELEGPSLIPTLTRPWLGTTPATVGAGLRPRLISGSN
jgi:hypothetical protein